MMVSQALKFGQQHLGHPVADVDVRLTGASVPQSDAKPNKSDAALSGPKTSLPNRTGNIIHINSQSHSRK